MERTAQSGLRQLAVKLSKMTNEELFLRACDIDPVAADYASRGSIGRFALIGMIWLNEARAKRVTASRYFDGLCWVGNGRMFQAEDLVRACPRVAKW